MKHLVLVSALVLLQNFFAKAINLDKTQPYSNTVAKDKALMNESNQQYLIDRALTPLLGINTLTVKPTANGIVLSWTVEETANLQYFLIEYAVDGQRFSPLFEVPVQAMQRIYSYTDTATQANEKGVYYRIKAVYPTKVLESVIRKLDL